MATMLGPFFRKLAGVTLAASVLVLSLAAPAAAPASANTGVVLRNIVVLGAAAAAALGITNDTHKRHLKNEEDDETDRRQASFKAFYYRKTGAYPTQEQIHEWYLKTYGTRPVN